MPRQTDEPDVIIVGGGPVGLGLAIDLSLRGVRTCVLERTTELHRIPKGQNLTQRTAEHFRAWGVLDDVRAASSIPSDFPNAGLVAYGTLLGGIHHDWFRRGAVNQYYFARNERLPQYALEAVLRRRAEAASEIEIRYGCEVHDAVGRPDCVTVDYTNGSGTEAMLAAPYVVGCDGARSVIRDAAGIEQAIGAHVRRMALLVFRSKELHQLLRRFPPKSIYNVLTPELDGYWQFLGRVDLDGGWFYHAPVPEGTTTDKFDFAGYLHQAIGAEFAIDFEHIGFWDLRIAVARTYQAGRMFIAGDAAHSHPPYGGYGVNNGLEDARNLSWKLGAQFAGWAGPELLASYSAERRPVFDSTSKEFIARMIEDDRAFLRAYSPERDRGVFDAAWARRAAGGNTAVTQYLPNYAGSPIVFGPDGARSGATGSHMVKARAGHHLAPQPLPGGRDMFDLLGDGLTLLSFGAANTERFAHAAAARGVPLSVVAETSKDLARAYEAELVLVRPDLFVAWAGSDGDAEAIIARIVGG